MTEDELYHSDFAISSHQLQKMLISPKAFYDYLFKPHEPPTEAMKRGTMLHTAVLEPHLLDPKTPNLILNAASKAKELLPTGGSAECPVFTRHNGILYRAKPDYVRLINGTMEIYDLKSTKTLAMFPKSCVTYGYYFQLAFYGWILTKTSYLIEPLPKEYFLLAVEMTPPHESEMYYVNEAVERAYEQVVWCQEQLEFCIRRNEWPE